MRGFTLLEILLVIGIIAVLISISSPFLLDFYRSWQIETTGQEIVQTARRAQLKAVSGEMDSNFGVRFSANQYALFRGDSFLSRDTAYDEVFELAPGLNLSGISEIVFLKPEGKTNPPEGGDIILTNGQKTFTININQLGRVNLNE